MIIEYRVGFNEFGSKWVCPEHKGWVWTNKFVPWWKQHCDIQPPTTVDEALHYVKNFAIYAYLEHNGDFIAATKDLVGQGYGDAFNKQLVNTPKYKTGRHYKPLYHFIESVASYQALVKRLKRNHGILLWLWDELGNKLASWTKDRSANTNQMENWQ